MELEEILELFKEVRDALISEKPGIINGVIDRVFAVLVLKFTNKFMEKEKDSLNLVNEFFKGVKK